jgi:uncharacterized membrane protein YphA (DoxX/SURF4 family)
VPEPEAVIRWSFAHRVVFRFLCCYWLLYSLPEGGRVHIFGAVPGASFLFKPYADFCHFIAQWVATHVFHITGRAATFFRTGSGDTTLQYILALLYLVVALVATLVWSILDRRRPNYRTLHDWLRLLVRYTLAFTLFGYGFAKVFPLQFQPPQLGKLVEPYGEFSPMGVLWSFMGASMAYTIFSGSAEVLGGLLLLFRRTTTLGAMVSFAVMVNVAALNYCYDVPVKLYSTHLALMALFLLAPELRRLADVFLLNRATAASRLTGPVFPRRWQRIAVTVFWVVFVGYSLFGQIYGGWQGYKKTYITPQRPPLYGLYDVESGPKDWRKVIISFPTIFSVRTIDDTTRFFLAEYGNNTVTLDKKDRLTWSRPDAGHVVLEGNINGSPEKLRLRKIDTSQFLLFKRGFHWINEMPFNR